VDDTLAPERSERLVIRQTRQPPQGDLNLGDHVGGRTLHELDELHYEVSSAFLVVELAKKFGHTITVLLLRLGVQPGLGVYTGSQGPRDTVLDLVFARVESAGDDATAGSMFGVIGLALLDDDVLVFLLKRQHVDCKR